METRQVTVDIPAGQFDFIMELFKSLGLKTNNNVNSIPQWQMDEVKKRLAEYDKNPDIALDFDQAMDDIESEL